MRAGRLGQDVAHVSGDILLLLSFYPTHMHFLNIFCKINAKQTSIHCIFSRIKSYYKETFVHDPRTGCGNSSDPVCDYYHLSRSSLCVGRQEGIPSPRSEFVREVPQPTK